LMFKLNIINENDYPELRDLPKPNERVVFDDWGYRRPGLLIDYIFREGRILGRIREDGCEILTVISKLNRLSKE
jgi:hypothetical protein